MPPAPAAPSPQRASPPGDGPLAGCPAPSEDFARFFRVANRYVWSSLKRLGVRADDLEDQAHEAFLALYRHRDDYDPARPLHPWVFAFALRIASDYRKNSWQRRRPAPLEHEPPAPDQDASDALAQRQERALVYAALDELDLDRRAVFVMHELDGDPIPVVAEALGVPLNTAYSRLRSARELFTAALKRAHARRAHAPTPAGATAR